MLIQVIDHRHPCLLPVATIEILARPLLGPFEMFVPRHSPLPLKKVRGLSPPRPSHRPTHTLKMIPVAMTVPSFPSTRSAERGYDQPFSRLVTVANTLTTADAIFGLAPMTAIAISTSITAYSTVVTAFSPLRLFIATIVLNILVHLLSF